MASLRRLENSPNWIACFALPNGRRTQRSTGTKDRELAMRIAFKFEDAARLAKDHRLVESAARRTIGDIYELANGNRLASSTVCDFFQNWLNSKELESSDRSIERYRVVVN